MATSTTWQLEQNAAEQYDRVVVPSILGPFARILVDHAKLRSGDRVVDVGCGTGAASLYAATLVGDTGKVLGVDISAEMLAVARSRAEAEGLAIEWREADASKLPLPADSADCVVCAQTIQFVSDRSTALLEMSRILKRGGRAAIGAWCPLSDNPYFQALVDAVSTRIGPDLANGLRAACALGDARALSDLLSSAGFQNVSTEVVEQELDLPPLASFVESHVLATPMAAGFQASALDVQRAIIDDVIGTFESSRIPFRSHVVLGHG